MVFPTIGDDGIRQVGSDGPDFHWGFILSANLLLFMLVMPNICNGKTKGLGTVPVYISKVHVLFNFANFRYTTMTMDCCWKVAGVSCDMLFLLNGCGSYSWPWLAVENSRALLVTCSFCWTVVGVTRDHGLLLKIRRHYLWHVLFSTVANFRYTTTTMACCWEFAGFTCDISFCCTLAGVTCDMLFLLNICGSYS